MLFPFSFFSIIKNKALIMMLLLSVVLDCLYRRELISFIMKNEIITTSPSSIIVSSL